MLTSLSADTLYHFQVRSTDAAGNRAQSSDQTFRTPAPADITPPVLSDVVVENITDHSARVSWITDEPSSSVVDHGLTDGYELDTIADDALVFTHHVDVIDLRAQTFYHVRARSRDAAGNEGVSGDRTFTTERDVSPPAAVSNFTAVPDVNYVQLRWTLPPDPDLARIVIVRRDDDFPSSPDDGIRIFSGLGRAARDVGLAADHDYFYAAFSVDTSGNESGAALARAHTLAVPPEIPPPPTPPAAPAVPIPPAAPGGGASALSLDAARFLLSGRTIPAAFINARLSVFPVTTVSVVVPFENLPARAERVVMNLGEFSYLLSRNDAQQLFEADVSAPEALGSYPGALIFTYENGASEAVTFTLAVVGFGIVTEDHDGSVVPAADAAVTLLDAGGVLVPWDGSRYRAVNPVITSAQGTYSFLVPAGAYALRAEKPGFLTTQTARFLSSGNVVNISTSLVALPPPLSKVIKPGAPLSENTVRVLEAIGKDLGFTVRAAPRILRRIVDNPTVEKVAGNVTAPAAVGIGVAAAAAGAAGAAPFASLGLVLRGLITQPFLLLFRRRRKRWGMVYHALLKLPIDLAVVRVLDTAANRVIQSAVTDPEGRFAFIVPPGNYRIEVMKPGFLFPTVLLREKTVDLDFADLYHGEPIAVTEAGTAITPNIPLDPVERVDTPHSVKRRRVLRGLQYALSAGAVIVSLGSFIIAPSLLTGGFLILQVLLFEFFRRVARGPRPKGWGIVYDAATRKPLRFAFARIFDTQFNKLLETRVTDASGRYAFLVGRNRFRVTFDREGYEPHEVTIEATDEKKKIITERIGLHPTDTPAPAPPPPETHE